MTQPVAKPHPMERREYLPSASLAHIARTYSRDEVVDLPETSPIFRDELCFRLDAGAPALINREPNAGKCFALLSVASPGFTIATKGRASYWRISLKRGALTRLLRIDARGRGMLMALDDTHWAAELGAALRAARSDAERIALSDDALTSRLSAALSSDLVEAALDHIAKSSGDVEVDVLAEELRVGRRSLERAFAARLASSPKLEARYTRCLAVAAKIAAGVKWKDLDFAPYADQSHFIREARSFHGLSPRAIRMLGPYQRILYFPRGRFEERDAAPRWQGLPEWVRQFGDRQAPDALRFA